MPQAWLAVLLFGFLHPISKPILDSGFSAFGFAAAFVGLRLVMTIPLLRGARWTALRHNAGAVVLIGLAGAALQISEFHAIKVGLPVQAVSFLVFTVPLWTMVFGMIINRERLTPVQGIKALITLAGAALVVIAQRNCLAPWMLALPLVAGMALGLWVSLSRHLKERGMATSELSFAYDVMSLAFITGFIVSRVPFATVSADLLWLKEPAHVAAMAAYTALLGLVANFVFYGAARHVTAIRLGFVMALEPIISACLSFLLFGESMGLLMALGAGCIVLANVPDQALQWLAPKARTEVPS